MTTSTRPRTNGSTVTLTATSPVTLRGAGRDPVADACATGSGPETPPEARSGLKSVCTRAISRLRRNGKGHVVADATSKVRDAASKHAGDVRAAVAAAKGLTEPLTPLHAAARTVAPAKGEAPNWVAWVGMTVAGLFRLAVTALGTLVVHAVATRIRAGVALALFVVAVGAHLLLRG